MEFHKNLEANREITRHETTAREASGEREMPLQGEAKEHINQLLFQWMPPETTLADMEDFACAIWQTIFEAWTPNQTRRDARGSRSV